MKNGTLNADMYCACGCFCLLEGVLVVVVAFWLRRCVWFWLILWMALPTH